MNGKLKKDDIFVQAAPTKYICQEAKEKKGRRIGEVTIGIATIAIPVKNFAPNLSKPMFRAMQKVIQGFPDVDIKFNFNTQAEAYIAVITAKTECREDDTFNEEIGKKIVDSKIQAIALRIAKKMAEAFKANYDEWSAQMSIMQEFFEAQIEKEKAYVSKALYLPKEESKQEE